MGIKRLTGDLAQTTVGANPGVTIPGATQVLGLTDWTLTIKVKTVDATTTDEDAWEDSLPSSTSWTVKAKYVYLMGDASQMTNIIQAIIGSGRRTSSEWNFFLDSTSGDDSFSGQAYISGLGVPVAIGRTVTMEVTLQGRGPLNLRNQASFRNSLIVPAGHAAKTFSVSLGGNVWGVKWSDFSLISTPLPADAAIVGIYAVIIASGTFDIAFQILTYAPGVPTGSPGFVNPFPFVGGASFDSTEFYGDNIGPSLSILVGQTISMAIDSSNFLNPVNDSISASGVGFAIYYESGTPTTDDFMPAPFAVPAGQGLTWALPAGVELIGPPAANGIVSGNAALGVV